jgi:hypothetical protein
MIAVARECQPVGYAHSMRQGSGLRALSRHDGATSRRRDFEPVRKTQVFHAGSSFHRFDNSPQ